MAEPSPSAPTEDDYTFELGNISIKVKLPSSEIVVRKAIDRISYGKPCLEEVHLLSLTTNIEEMVVLAGAFGRENALDALTIKLMKDLSFNDEGNVDFKIKDIDSIPVLQNLTDNIRKIRIAMVN
ncbi:hypothetical protein V8E51_003063 [Hyaloscypha variabilis]